MVNLVLNRLTDPQIVFTYIGLLVFRGRNTVSGAAERTS